jgi:hypothetical protein
MPTGPSEPGLFSFGTRRQRPARREPLDLDRVRALARPDELDGVRVEHRELVLCRLDALEQIAVVDDLARVRAHLVLLDRKVVARAQRLERPAGARLHERERSEVDGESGEDHRAGPSGPIGHVSLL